MSVRHALMALNIVVLVGLAIYAIRTVLSPKRHDEERTPANRTPFFGDDDLEGRRLERVLGWALVFAGVIAVALPLYWLREPTRQSDSTDYFSNGAVDRGAVLFANAQSEDYNSAVSLQCANCHGSDGGGGSAKTTIDPDGPNGPEKPVSVVWSAPALNTVLYRFSQEEVTQIITYGRPGTPMQPWGVQGGGPKNEQSIADLVAYLESIQLRPEKAQAEAADALKKAQSQAADQVKAAQKALDAAEKAFDDATAALQKQISQPTADEATLTKRCEDLAAHIDDNRADLADVDKDEAADCRVYLTTLAARDDAVDALDWARSWRESRRDVTDGQLLFEINCARCHTEGWSVFNPAIPNDTRFLGLAGGGGGTGGGIGFNLRNGAPIRRFGTGKDGHKAQVDFVSIGSEAFKAYGYGGQGSGKMPGFGEEDGGTDGMLTNAMIKQIVDYERGETANGTKVKGLDDTTYLAPSTEDSK